MSTRPAQDAGPEPARRPPERHMAVVTALSPGGRGGTVPLVDDAALLRRAARKDDRAFDTLVRRHAAAVWRLARMMLHDDFQAEEATQDTFLKAHRSMSGFRGDASVKTWLLSICRRTCLDVLRARKPSTVPLEEIDPPGEPEDGPEFWMTIRDAMRDLPPEDREAFYLVDVLGHSREEAAGIVDVPASTMRSRVARARQRLADALASEDDLRRQS